MKWKHVNAKTSENWLYHWIQDPRSFRAHTWMPSFFGQYNNSDPESLKRAQQEIHAIVQYLVSHSEEYNLKEIPFEGDSKNGEELVVSLGCLGCHVTGSEEELEEITTRQQLRREHGPSLTGLGTKTTEKWIYNWVKDPTRYHAQTKMPNLRLSDQEAADIAAYLAAERKDEFLSKPSPDVQEAIMNDIVKGFLIKMETFAQADQKIANMALEEKMDFAGEKLLRLYGCFGCHDIPGFEKDKPIGTDLSEWGSKSVHRLDFGFIDIDHSRYSFAEKKLQDPRIFDKDLIKDPTEKARMPNFNFNDEEIKGLVTVLLGLVKEKPEESKIASRTSAKLFVEEGQRIVRQFNCQGCHIMEGEGSAIQPTLKDWLIKFKDKSDTEAEVLVTSYAPPNLIGEGAKVQAEWLFDFIHQPTTVRPWLKVRMPTFNFKSDQINALVRYFSYLDDQDFPFAPYVESHLSEEEYLDAEKLFSAEYFDCAKCHIVGDQFPAGSPESWAPDFAMAKKRLKPDWIIDWIKNPQELLPGTNMPTFFDLKYFDQSGPDDLFDGDENRQIRALRDYIVTLADKPTKPEIPPVTLEESNQTKIETEQ